MKFLGY